MAELELGHAFLHGQKTSVLHGHGFFFFFGLARLFQEEWLSLSLVAQQSVAKLKLNRFFF
jgi:hypothetical protein